MKRKILLLMMTALLSVGAWAASDVTLNVGEITAFDYGLSNKSESSFTVTNWGTVGWTFDTALSQDDYYGVEFTVTASTANAKLKIIYDETYTDGEDVKNYEQVIDIPSGGPSTIVTHFSYDYKIKKIGFREHSGGSTDITVTSAVVKAYDSDKDFTLNMTYAKNFNDWGTFNVSENTIEVALWSEGGWSVSLNKDKYCGVDFSFTEETTAKIYLKIVYADATDQSIEIPVGSTHITAYFSHNANISKIGFRHGDDGHSSNVSITINSAVVKAWGNGDLSIKVPGVNENSTITLGQWGTNDTWVFGKTLSQENYSGIDLTFSKTDKKITLQITYANNAVYSYEIPAESTHIAVGFEVDSNISKIGFKHNDYLNGEAVSITITNAVILSSTTGTEVDVLGDTSFSVPDRYNYHAYKTFDSAIDIDDYEKVVFTFSSDIPEDGLSLQAKIKDGDAKTIGSLIKNGSKVTGYFSNMSSATIESIGFVYGWNSKQGTDDATTLSIASAKLYKKPTQIITIGSMSNGTVTPSVTDAWEGKTVTLTAAPDENYELGTLTVTDDATGAAVSTSGSGNTYPATAVTVNATFNHVAEALGANDVALNTDRIICTTAANSSVRSVATSVRYYSNSGELWVGTGEHNGWDLSLGRPVSTTEFSGVYLNYKSGTKNVKMEICYEDGTTETSDVLSGSNATTINFSGSRVVKYVKFIRDTEADAVVAIRQIALKGTGASASTPASSLTLTYETLMDGGSNSVDYDNEDSKQQFEIKEGAGHWAGWIFTLPISTTLYNGINFNMTAIPTDATVKVEYENAPTQSVDLTTGDNNVVFSGSGNITKIYFEVVRLQEHIGWVLARLFAMLLTLQQLPMPSMLLSVP